jgi:type VI protein secretion system component Hcp
MPGAYLRLDGIRGDAHLAGSSGWIELNSVAVGRGGQTATASADAKAHGAYTTFTCSAYVGIHSPALFSMSSSGRISRGELALMNRGGPFATAKLQSAMIASISASTDQGGGRAVESFTVDAAPFRLDYAVGSQLVGSWSVTIGTWTGTFVFESGGTVYWTEPKSPTRHRGKWKTTASDVQWKFTAPGDIRTFVIPFPVPDSPVSGRILPAGQGFFSMSRD